MVIVSRQPSRPSDYHPRRGRSAFSVNAAHAVRGRKGSVAAGLDSWQPLTSAVKPKKMPKRTDQEKKQLEFSNPIADAADVEGGSVSPSFEVEGEGDSVSPSSMLRSTDSSRGGRSPKSRRPPVDTADEITVLRIQEKIDRARITELENLVSQRSAKLDVAERALESLEARSMNARKARAARQARKKKAQSDGPTPRHKSSNNLAWLENSIVYHRQRLAEKYKYPIHLEIAPGWGFQFSMPDKTQRAVDINDEDGDGIVDAVEMDEDELATKLTRERGATTISHEAWILCERAWACDLDVGREVSMNGNTLFITIGACHGVLAKEAHTQGFELRLQESKGMMPFREDLIQYFASNHGGLDEWNHGSGWEQRDPALSEDWAEKLKDYHDDDLIETLTAEEKAERTRVERRVFTSSSSQRLCIQRLKRLGHLDPEDQMKMKSPDQMRKYFDSHATKHRKIITGKKIMELLTAHGGFRTGNETVFPVAEDGRTLIATVARSVLSDPNLRIHPKLGFVTTVQTAHAITYADLTEIVQIFDAWRDLSEGPGREETFTGTLKKFFPLHHGKEITYLQEMWGSPKIICKGTLVGYNPETTPKTIETGPPSVMENNTFSSPGNSLHEHALPWSWYFQPIEEIR